MLNESELVFDEHMIASGGVTLPSTATAYAGLVHSEKFAKADLIGIFIVVTIPATGVGTVEAQIEHCSDGVHWQNKNDTEEINESSWPGVGEQAAYGGEAAPARPTLEFVRLRITLTGFASRVKAYMVGRLKEEPKEACACSAASATSPIDLERDGFEPPPDPDDRAEPPPDPDDIGNVDVAWVNDGLNIGFPSFDTPGEDPEVLDKPFGNGHVSSNFLVSHVHGGSELEQAGDEVVAAVSRPRDGFPNGFVMVGYVHNPKLPNGTNPPFQGLHFAINTDVSLTRYSALSTRPGFPGTWPCPTGGTDCKFGQDVCVSAIPQVLPPGGRVAVKPWRFAITSFGAGGVAIGISDNLGGSWTTYSVSDVDEILHLPEKSKESPDHPWHVVDETTGDIYVVYYLNNAQVLRIRRMQPAVDLEDPWDTGRVRTVPPPSVQAKPATIRSAVAMHVSANVVVQSGQAKLVKKLHLVWASNKAGPCGTALLVDADYWYTEIDLPISDSGALRAKHERIFTGRVRSCALSSAKAPTAVKGAYHLTTKPAYAVDGVRHFIAMPVVRGPGSAKSAIVIYWRDIDPGGGPTPGWKSHTVTPSTEQQWRPALTLDPVAHRLLVSWSSTDPSSGLTHRRGLLQSYDPSAPMSWTGKPFVISVGVQGEPHGSTFSTCGGYDYDSQVTLPDGRFLVIWDDARGAVLERRTLDPFDWELPILVLNAGCSRVWGAIVS